MTIREVLEHPEKFSCDVARLGECTVDSPVTDGRFVEDGDRTLFLHDESVVEETIRAGRKLPSFEKAGPRRRIFFDPAWCRAAVVTCGGLCPGLNDVIKALVNTLFYTYGVDCVYGIRYGYSGLVGGTNIKPIELNPDVVDSIHIAGGSILGSSRGEQSTEEIIKTLDRMKINMLFTIGGDGTQRGAHEIAVAAIKRGLPVSVVGIPKTIDNDLNCMDKTFGFETAVEMAAPIIGCAHNEAKGAFNGIGLVRLMGRDSGFIAAYASLANSVVNFCLIPEVEFELDGPQGFFNALEKRLADKHHAVIVVAEGAGQNLFNSNDLTKDKSGNILHKDIGVFLKERIGSYLKGRGIEHSIKYFDPSYIIRSAAASGNDSIFCLHLAQHAVHAAMAGMTDMVVGNWQGYFTYVPIALATAARRKIDPRGQLWQSVLLTARQNRYWK
jgi:6-phosphofructokinase 1